MNLEAECNSEIASYFRDRKELYLDRANIYGEVMREIDRLAVEYNNGWIPCSERLPDSLQTVILCHLGQETTEPMECVAEIQKIVPQANVCVAERGLEVELRKKGECPF